MIKSVDIESLLAIFDDPTVKVVDTRPMSAFNGWRLRDESRGGHIPGAIAFPETWAAGLLDADLVEMLAAKGLVTGLSIILYGYEEQDSTSFAPRLANLGFADVSVFAGGFSEWASRPDLDVIRLPRNQQLVHPQWLHGLLDGDQTAEAPKGDFGLFHVNYGVPEEYARGHIPGAVHLDTNTLESASDWNRRSPDELEAALMRLGITTDTTVILYGRDTATNPEEQKPGRNAGQIAATRAAAILQPRRVNRNGIAGDRTA